jgi:coenzyme F420-dependent glucose-6-phosphate dehydrogenase
MPVILGYKTCHEQYDPVRLLEHAVLAEKCGFETLWTSDHFHPWAHTGASGGFAWLWMASAAERTRKMRIGTSVTAPILRYHPAIVAQAFATLAFTYPDRIFLGVGAGEALNESPLGYRWPSPKERLEMLEEAIIIIRKLWTEEFVTLKGKYYCLKKANLYTKPPNPMKIIIAAGGPRAAELAGRLGDGVMVATGSIEAAKKLLRVFEDGARKAGRDPDLLEKVPEVMVSYSDDYEAALKSCRFWAGCMIPSFFNQDISDPREIEPQRQTVTDDAIAKKWIVATTAEEHIRRVREFVKAGFNHLELLSSNPDERKFIELYAREVLPHLKE